MTLSSLGQQILVELFNFIIYSVTFLVVGTTMKLHDVFCFYIEFDVVFVLVYAAVSILPISL